MEKTTPGIRENDSSLSSGKIAVVTTNASINKEDFHSPDSLIAKYGEDKIIRHAWPENFMDEQTQMIELVTTLAKDNDIKALIINQAVEGTNAAVDKLKEIRDDLFITYCNTNENFPAAAARANLVFSHDLPGMARAIVKQAKKQGAITFVHYSFPRHMAISTLSDARKIIKDSCAEEGLIFLDLTTLDPTGEAGITGAQQFILDDVPRITAKYGEDTAFYSTNCHHQSSLIKAVVDSHAIYPQPCCPSPFHGFPEAFNITFQDFDLHYIFSEISSVAEERNMTDRLSSWPVSGSMLYTNAGAEYAIKWLNGTVPKNDIDNAVLTNCMTTYIKEAIGEESAFFITPYSENGTKYNNFKMVHMGYLDF